MDATFNTPAGEVRIVERNGTARGWSNKPRIYASFSTFDVLEDLANRNRRPFRQWRKLVIAAVEASGVGIDTARMGWDQRAGCSCGCSPGFVLDNHNSVVVDGKAFHNYDVFVTLPASAPTVDETKAPRFEREIVTIIDEPVAALPEPELVGA